MKKNLLNSLLVTLMVLVGGSAWAQTTTLLEYGTADVAWTADNLAEWTAGGTPTITDGYVGISGGNGSYATSKTIAPTANAIINVQAVWRGRSNTGRDFSKGNGSYFRFGNIIVAQNDQDKKHGYGFAGLSNIGSVTTFTAGSYRTDIANCTWLLIEMEINTASNTVTSFTVKSEDGATTYASTSDIVLADADYTTVAFGYHKSGSVSTANAEQLKSIKITQTTQSVETANYSVKFVCNDTEIKDADSRVGVVGQAIALTDADIQNFYATNGSKKYIYVSSDVEGKTVSEGAVVTVTFREAATYAWTAKSNVGTYTISGETFEGDKASAKYPLYVLVDDTLWTKGATSQTFAQSFDVTENNQEFTLTYTKTEIPAIFYAEVEDITGMTAYTAGNAAARSSQQGAGYSAEGKTLLTSLPVGKYKMFARFYSPTSAGGKYNFFTGNRNIWEATTGNANATDLNTEVVLAKENNAITLGQGGYTQAVDFIYIQKLADPTAEELAAADSADQAADVAAAAAAALAEAKVAFQTDITAAKAIDTIGKNGAAELAAAITAAETAIAAKDATVDSITAAKAELAKAVSAFRAANFNFATAIVNADFSSMEGWTENVSGGFRDFGNGLIGTYRVRTDDFIPAATVDETHLATEYCIGLEARWDGNFASYNQDVMLPAGNYKLTFDVENVNAGTTSANYNNLFKVTNGETVYVDESTEWMNGKSGWTSHAIRFILTEDATVNISLGYGTGSNNFGHANTPALYVSHLALGTFDPLVDFKEIALKAVDALPTGDALFLYPVDAVNTAKAAIETAATVDDINAAVATAKAAQNKPAADKAYKITNTTATGNLCIAEGKISVAQGATVKFTAVEGGYVLSKDSLYVFKTTDNNWTLSTTKNIAEAYVLTFNPVEGGYTIKGAKGLFGLDSTDEGSTVYANKAQSNNGLWTIAEYVAPSNDYTSYIVNADLTGEGGFDATGTKGIDGSGIVKVGSAAAFDFKQTIANLPAGKYKVTAQAAYRYGADEAAEAAAIAAETDTKLVQLYATVGEKTVSAKVQNRYDGASETDYANGGSVTVNEKFVPNSSDAVKAWFAAGQYVNEVIFNLPADGAVTIGINRTGTPESDYTVIGPWTLTRLGDAEAEVEPEPEPTPEPGADMTAKITNPSFETGDLTGWTVGNSADTGVKPNSNATYTTEGCDGNYLFNTWWQGIPITQVVKGLPNGLYELKALMANDAITAGNKPGLYLLANGQHSAAFSSTNAGTFAEGTMQFYVTDGTATIGAVGGNADGTFNEAGYYWYKVDNFRLKYVEALPNIEDVEIPEGKMSIAAANAMITAKEAGDVVALIQAVNNAKSSIAAYAHVKELLDFVAEEAAKTNVYTAAAKEKFDSICTATLNGYNEGTISDADANAFNIGIRTEGLIPELFLSAYTSTVDGTPYINTWSVEGDNDGSEFKVPFYEYWVGDNDALAANTITAKVEGLKAGEYDVTAWVRVRIKNGAEAPATGITLQANDGEAVDVAAGDQVGTSQMYLKEFTATGTVAEDGVLKIKFNVAADNNISWLSFKNVKFEKKPFKPEAIEGALYSWESPEGLPGEYGGKISYVNGVDNRLNYQNSGYYTICLNGKKANMNDTIAKADASYMLVTLDEALSEGDTIYITAYVNKNASKKASAYILFDNGADVESPVYSDEANIDTLFNGVPTTKSIIVTEAMAGAKSFKMTRGQTGTNLFITKFVIMKKKSEPVEPAKYEYNGYVAIARIAQNNVLGDVTSETQKVTITETEDKAIVAVTFSGFETFPEFTFNANVTGGDSVTYTVAEGSKVNVQQGQMAIEYNLTGNGTQASTEAIPTIALQMSQNPAMTINVVFAATAEEAKAALLKTTGIINIARDAQKNVIYNINGQKVNKAQKGLFIINGKKVVNK